jgi:hypothetical protein
MLLAAGRIARPDFGDLWLLSCLALDTDILWWCSLRFLTILGTGCAPRAFAKTMMRSILVVTLRVLRLLRSLLRGIAAAIGIMGHWILRWMRRHDAVQGSMSSDMTSGCGTVAAIIVGIMRVSVRYRGHHGLLC